MDNMQNPKKRFTYCSQGG